MFCRCPSQELFDGGLAAIPHGRTAEDYNKLLNGALELPPLRDDAARIEPDHEPLAIEDGPPRPAPAAEDGIMDDGEPPSEGTELAADGPADDPAADAGEDGPADDPAADGPADALAAGPEAAEAAILDGVLADMMWGVFRLTWKPAASIHGSLQVVCRFHRKNTHTGCKKLFGCQGPDVHHRREVAKLAMWWASQHRDFDRHCTHMADANINPLECPPATVLAGLRVDVLPPVCPATDLELDAAAAAPGPG